MTPNRILIVDGTNFFIRHYVVNPSMNDNGDSVGGVIGFLRGIKNLIKEVRPTQVIVVWDGQNGSLKRRSLYKEYKAGRKPRVNRSYDFGQSPEQSAQDMVAQNARVRRCVDLLGIPQIEVDSIEADDVIGYLCYVYEKTDKVLVSTDKDFLQLVDTHTLVYSPSKKVYFTASVVKEKHFVIPKNFIYLKALVGDASDNIKGIKGIGEKTVIKLFPFLAEKESSLEEIVAHAQTHMDKNPKMKAVYEGREVLSANVQLMQLSTPIISLQSTASIKHAILPNSVQFVPTEIKITLIRDGIQLTDNDFFQVFKEYHTRAQNGDTQNV